jgi:hypothetical protein
MPRLASFNVTQTPLTSPNIDNYKGKCQISEILTDNPYQYNIQDARNHISRETQRHRIKRLGDAEIAECLQHGDELVLQRALPPISLPS